MDVSAWRSMPEWVQVSSESRKGKETTGNWHHSPRVAQYDCLELNSGLLEEQCVLLTAESTLPHPAAFWLKLSFCVKASVFPAHSWVIYMTVYLVWSCFKVRYWHIAPFALIVVVVLKTWEKSKHSKISWLLSWKLWTSFSVVFRGALDASGW